MYLTLDSQRALDAASGARARYVELMHVSIQVEPVPYNTGHYTVDITYYYRVLGETSSTGSCPNTITGLAVFSKRLVLFGGESKAKTFLSRECGCLSKQTIVNCACPTGVVEVVDPIILGSCVQDACSCCCNPEPPAIPEPILACFDQELVLKGECKRCRCASARPDGALPRGQDSPAASAAKSRRRGSPSAPWRPARAGTET